MILKNIKVEYKDEKTGLVLKRIITSEWETHNHKLAINNSLFVCEQQRLINKKPILNDNFQIHHTFFNNKRKTWNFDKMSESKAHASKLGRLYLTFQQRNTKQWEDLTFKEAESDFQDLTTRGLNFVPYHIPLDTSLEKWKKRKEDALSLLNKGQNLFPIFSSKHQRELFEEIFNYEFENSKIIGIQCYSLNDTTTLLNLMKIKLRNMKLQTGDECPILIGLNYDKVQRKLSFVSGSFAYSCFGFDILSCRQLCIENMPPDARVKMLNKNIDEIMRYDKTLGGFNLSAEQEFWYGVNLTKAFLESVVLTEGLSQYQAIQWANHITQQKDFDTMNNYILDTINEENAVINYISEKEKWDVYFKTKILQLTKMD